MGQKLVILRTKCHFAIVIAHKIITPMIKTPNKLHYFAQNQLYSYGIQHLLIIMKCAERIENYELCQAIKDVIEDHNLTVRDNLPTKLDLLNSRL